MSMTLDGSASVTINSGAVLGITSGTAVASTSGTSIDFTSIPSWVKRITVMFNGVSTGAGVSAFLIQIGTSGGVVNTGYNSTGTGLGSSVLVTTASTAGFLTRNGRTAGTSSGVCYISNVTGNTWVVSGAMSSAANTEGSCFSGGVALAGVLDRVRITTANGTDVFAAGSVNILYE